MNGISLNLLIAIAHLCELHSESYAVEVQKRQMQCHAYYAECLDNPKKTITLGDVFKCMKQRSLQKTLSADGL